MWHCHPRQAQCDKYWKYIDHRTKRGSIARKGRVKEGSSPHSSSRTRALCYRCHVLAAPPLPFPPLLLGKSHLLLAGDTHYFFPILPLNITTIPFHAGIWGRFRFSCRVERKGGDPTACQHSPLRDTQKNRSGWFGQCMAWGYFARSKANISVHTPTTHPEKGQHEVTAMENHTNSTEL